MNSGPSFYKNRVTRDYFQHIEKKYGRFILEIHKECNKPQQVVVELGCGISNITRSLALKQTYLPAMFIAIDNNDEMLKLSADNIAASGLKNINVERGDILIDEQVPEGSIAHSHGVLEHFTDEQIRTIIGIQKRKFKTMIHYVPSAKYKTPSFGDERLLMPGEWFDICRPNQIIPFNEGFDLILIWRNK